MDQVETQETPAKEGRGRQSKTISFSIQLPMADCVALTHLTLKRMKQLGEDVSRDRVISEAIQCLAKSLSGQE